MGRLLVENENTKRMFGKVLPLPEGTTLQEAYAIAMKDYHSTKKSLEKGNLVLEKPKIVLSIGWKAREE